MPRLAFLMTLLLFLSACTPNKPLPNSPEAAVDAQFPNAALRFLSREGVGNTMLLTYRGIAPPMGNNGLANATYVGSAYLEHNGREWIVWRSNYSGRIDPATVPAGQLFVFGVSDIVVQPPRGEPLAVWHVEGQTIDARIAWVEIRLTNGDIRRTRPIDAVFALVTPHGEGVCAIRILDENGAVLESTELAANRQCVPTLFWE